MAKISVIVPVYRAEAYLAECIDSILSQTFQDFEIMLVDDGSPDNSYEICREYVARDSRIRVLRQKNQGQAAARNHALPETGGEWICFVDSDDRIHPQMLELLYQAAMESGAAISMCRMLEGAQLPEDFEQPRTAEYTLYCMDEPTLLRMYDEEDYPAWVACAKLIRRELIEGYPFREGRVFEDNEAVCHWVCEGKQLARMEHSLYFYRKNEDSTTKSRFSLKKLDYLWALKRITEYYASIGYDQLRQRFGHRYVDAVISACNGVRYELDRPDLVRDIEKEARSFLKEQKLRLTQEEFEQFLDAAHPRLIRLYWPAAGAVRTLRTGGVSGLLKKLLRLGKGEKQ